MPEPTILAISARVGAGKTSLKDFFTRDGYNVIHRPIAETLKREVATALGLTPRWLEENKNLARPTLIAWAEFKRALEPFYWIDKLTDRIEYERQDKRLESNSIFYVDDVRYLNEVEQLKKLGAVTVQLECSAEESEVYMIGKGLSPEQAHGAATSQGETELAAHPEVFDITLSASRRRPLRNIYADLRMALLRTYHLAPANG